MIFKTNVLNRPNLKTTATAATGCALTRRFVLTGDERCPIAGIWSRIDATTPPAQPDEPSLTRPVTGAALWRAIHLFFTSLHYLPA